MRLPLRRHRTHARQRARHEGAHETVTQYNNFWKYIDIDLEKKKGP